jgi:hypothetical protein
MPVASEFMPAFQLLCALRTEKVGRRPLDARHGQPKEVSVQYLTGRRLRLSDLAAKRAHFVIGPPPGLALIAMRPSGMSAQLLDPELRSHCPADQPISGWARSCCIKLPAVGPFHHESM